MNRKKRNNKHWGRDSRPSNIELWHGSGMWALMFNKIEWCATMLSGYVNWWITSVSRVPRGFLLSCNMRHSSILVRSQGYILFYVMSRRWIEKIEYSKLTGRANEMDYSALVRQMERFAIFSLLVLVHPFVRSLFSYARPRHTTIKNNNWIWIGPDWALWCVSAFDAASVQRSMKHFFSWIQCRHI